jgi:hypothetical protein
MSLNFPSNPTANDIYSISGKSWVYNGYGWELQSVTSVESVAVSTFNGTGTGSQDTFNLGFNPISAPSLFVTIDGVVQPESTYTVNTSANTITFSTSPGLNESVRVMTFFARVNPYFLGDGTITLSKFDPEVNVYIQNYVTTQVSAAESSALALAIALG